MLTHSDSQTHTNTHSYTHTLTHSYTHNLTHTHTLIHTHTQHTESLQDSVSFQDLLFDPRADIAGDRTQVLQDELGRLRLPRPALSRDDARLVGALRSLQRFISRLCQREHVWLQSAHLLPVVSKHVFLEQQNTVHLVGQVPAAHKTVLLPHR
jgi:hypothetical protein